MAPYGSGQERFKGNRTMRPSFRLSAFSDLIRTVKKWHMSSTRLLAVVAVGMASGAASIGIVALTSMIVNGKLRSQGTTFLAFVASCVLAAVTRFFSESLLMRVINRAAVEIRLALSERVLSAPLALLETIGIRRVLVLLTEDVSTIVNAFGMVPYQCINLMVLLGGLCYLGSLSIRGLIVVLSFMSLGVISYRFGITTAMKRVVHARQIEEDFFEHLHALTSGIKELKLHGARRREFLQRVLRTTAESFCNSIIAGLTRFRLISSFSESLLFALLCLLLFSPLLSSTLKHADLVSFVIAITFMMGPLSGVLHTIPVVGHASVAIRKIEDFERQLPDEDSSDRSPVEATLPLGDLKLIGVSHKYKHEGEESDFILQPLTLTFARGDLVFITGGNGSGKTTLGKLLVGLYLPEDGYIALGGVAITSKNIELYRNCFSAIFADFYLFAELLGVTGDNIDSRAAYFLKGLQLSHKVQVYNGRLSTTLLSHGQRKRLALLAAYMEDRPFCLFDEWAADQDPTFKDVFYQDLLPRMKAAGKTLFVITHDERYYSIADRVIKLEEGIVVSDVLNHATAV